MSWRMRAIVFAALWIVVYGAGGNCEAQEAGAKPATSAICPIIYALDQAPTERGIHYVFYGNAFFINEDGYLLTAAHVLSDFQDGGQPQILVARRNGPPVTVAVKVVASDREHDIAVLVAEPNPFVSKSPVHFLNLAENGPKEGAHVIAAALRPSRMRDPHSYDAPQQDAAQAEVLNYVAISLNKGEEKTDLFLFSHEVIHGQSGAPVLDGSGDVVGIVEGQWLHPSPIVALRAAGSGATVGAAIPVGVAIRLLEQKHIAWHKREQVAGRVD